MVTDSLSNIEHKYSQPCVWFSNFPTNVTIKIYIDVLLGPKGISYVSLFLFIKNKLSIMQLSSKQS